MAGPLDPGHLFGHVEDADHFVVPTWFPGADDHGRLFLPQPFYGSDATIMQINTVQIKTGFEPLDQIIQPISFQLTKFMVLEVVVAILMTVIFIWLARRMRSSDRPQGVMANLFETMIVFSRDQIARPAIGRQDADRYLPFLLTLFFFILACNLFGLVPWAGSPTAALAVTSALAMLTFATVLAAGIGKFGAIGYWKALVPPMELPLVLAIVLKPMIFFIEILGLLIKHAVLAVRLLANMMAGHLVLAVVVAFVLASFTTFTSPTWIGVSTASVLGAVALNLLELLVAFLQAYIFVFLSALFIGMAVHPH